MFQEPKIVNGPEIFNKYVGQSEENIRALFAEAEAEYAQRGDDSDLHIIIFDEFDAICKVSRKHQQEQNAVEDSKMFSCRHHQLYRQTHAHISSTAPSLALFSLSLCACVWVCVCLCVKRR